MVVAGRVCITASLGNTICSSGVFGVSRCFARKGVGRGGGCFAFLLRHTSCVNACSATRRSPLLFSFFQHSLRSRLSALNCGFGCVSLQNTTRVPSSEKKVEEVKGKLAHPSDSLVRDGRDSSCRGRARGRGRNVEKPQQHLHGNSRRVVRRSNGQVTTVQLSRHRINLLFL